MSLRYRLGIDIGGTFTDATLLDTQTGEVSVDKVLTTPADPAGGFLEATWSILGTNDVVPSDVEFVVHATTIATNSIIEGKVARTGFVTTEGFRDMLELARQMRPSLYDLHFEKPKPLVRRYLCFGVPERLDAHGKVVVPLDTSSVTEIGRQLKAEAVEAVAVCLLHSYVNPEHEERVGAILRELLPDVVVSLSTEVTREFREYFRASTTVINAAVSPIVSRYLENIESNLRESGVAAELLIMQSSGGVYTSAAARQSPAFMVESGPAAGVIAATYLGTALGEQNIVSFDMGGTTAKVCLVQGGVPNVTKDYEVGAKAAPGSGGGRGAGYPIRTPVIDLVEIGAGGGSIAWVDPGGILRVGPQSAGADPGPACYARGGTEPTVTDANLVLGRLNARYFLGGGMSLDVSAAETAIARCATSLGLTNTETAHGIVEIANTAMVNALRLVSVQHGYDPRDFVLVAFGGAGPLHANQIAAENQIAVTVVPPSAGTFSAMGLLVTDIKREYTTTMIQQTSDAKPDELNGEFLSLEERGEAELKSQGLAPASIGHVRQIDMRYVGQSYELTIGVPRDRLTSTSIREVVERFHDDHARIYGHSAPDEPVEFVSLRVTTVGQIVKPRLREIEGATAAALTPREERSVYFHESGGFVTCPIYDRAALGAGARLPGPAVIEEFDTTTVVHPGYDAEVDSYGNLVLRRAANAPENAASPAILALAQVGRDGEVDV